MRCHRSRIRAFNAGARDKTGMLLSHTIHSRLLCQMIRDMDESLASIDRDYEHVMQRKRCNWIEKAGGQGTNHVLHRRWALTNSKDEVLLRVDSNGPTCISIHTILYNSSHPGTPALGHFRAATLRQCVRRGRLPTVGRSVRKTRNSKIWD